MATFDVTKFNNDVFRVEADTANVEDGHLIFRYEDDLAIGIADAYAPRVWAECHEVVTPCDEGDSK